MTSIRQEGTTVFFTQDQLDIDIWSDLSDMTKGRIRFTGMSKDAAVKPVRSIRLCTVMGFLLLRQIRQKLDFLPWQ